VVHFWSLRMYSSQLFIAYQMIINFCLSFTVSLITNNCNNKNNDNKLIILINLIIIIMKYKIFKNKIIEEINTVYK